jgi:dephospho-CoA kinase
MTEADLEAILAKQTPDAEKRAKADFIISTAFGFNYAQKQVSAILELMRELAEKGQKYGRADTRDFL